MSNLKKANAADETYLEKSLTGSEKELADNEMCIQELEHTMDTTDGSATKIDEADTKLKIFEEHVH